jgi:dTDP-4-amino-4,6-dideoxy-D-glucose/dTDP-4-amino-2,4-dideoxy-beta-L-xylose transaminase
LATIPVFKVFMSPDVQEPLLRVISSGYVGQGPQVEAFESKIAEFLGHGRSVTLNSATSGLHLTLHMIKTAPRNRGERRVEVLTTPMTCTATSWAILANGLKIKWVDVDPNTGNMCPKDAQRKISERTLAMMIVHWGGLPCDLDAFKAVQRDCQARFDYMPPIIEDAAHAWCSTYRGLPIGNHGNFAVYSFQAIKNLTTCDGGLLTLPDESSYKRAKLLRWYGLDRTSKVEFRCEQNVKEWGFKFHMNDVNATIGLHNMPHVPALVAKQQENVKHYAEALKGVAGVRSVLPIRHGQGVSSGWLCTLRVDRRDQFQAMLKSHGIDSSRVHDRNDKHEAVAQFKSTLPGTDEFCEDMICIPAGWWVTEEDRRHIVSTISKGW